MFTCFILSYTGSGPVAVASVPVYHDTPVEPNPSYQVLTTDQVEMAAYQELSSHSGRADVSKQKPAGSVDYYEDIINDQNVPSYDWQSFLSCSLTMATCTVLYTLMTIMEVPPLDTIKLVTHSVSCV